MRAVAYLDSAIPLTAHKGISRQCWYTFLLAMQNMLSRIAYKVMHHVPLLISVFVLRPMCMLSIEHNRMMICLNSHPVLPWKADSCMLFCSTQRSGPTAMRASAQSFRAIRLCFRKMQSKWPPWEACIRRVRCTRVFKQMFLLPFIVYDVEQYRLRRSRSSVTTAVTCIDVQRRGATSVGRWEYFIAE